MNNTLFPLANNPIIIIGPAGKVEAIIAPPTTIARPIVGIICHPHPLYGGTMTNKVVTTVARAFNELGAWAVRFNFRGVGQSEGSYGAAIGELEDLRAVMSWVKETFPDHQIWLAGFSFGAYVAARMATQENVAQLVTIAPAINHFDVKEIAGIHSPWILAMGEADELVPFAEVDAWVKTQSVPVKTLYFPGVGHFFHSHLTELREQLKAALT